MEFVPAAAMTGRSTAVRPLLPRALSPCLWLSTHFSNPNDSTEFLQLNENENPGNAERKQSTEIDEKFGQIAAEG